MTLVLYGINGKNEPIREEFASGEELHDFLNKEEGDITVLRVEEEPPYAPRYKPTLYRGGDEDLEDRRPR